MRKLAPLAIAFALLLSAFSVVAYFLAPVDYGIQANTAFAKGQPTPTTLPVTIDGITRTVTGVISDTFKVTATTWLDGLSETYNPAFGGTSINITATTKALDQLFAATDETAYPQHWTPFVRQYRFAIHTCRRWLSAHNDLIDAPTMTGPWFVLSTACYEQHQDAYVEMERTAVDVASGRFKD